MNLCNPDSTGSPVSLVLAKFISRKLQTEFVPNAKYNCINCNMKISKLQNTFVLAMYFLSNKPHKRNYKWIQLQCNNIKSRQHQSCIRFINSDRSSYRCPRFPPNFFQDETRPNYYVSYMQNGSINYPLACPFKIELYSSSSRVPL